MGSESLKFAVILSGCGFQDGAEIHESVTALLAISQAGHGYQCFAPDILQHHVTDHLTGEQVSEKRNVLVESARIARGKIEPLDKLDPKNFDVLIIPGGFGAALSLCTFGVDGPDCQVNEDVARVVRGFHQSGKPIGALCISPVILSKLLGNVTITVGQDQDVKKALESLGSVVQETQQGEVIIDQANRIVTTPCYMLDSSVAQIAEGTRNAVKALSELA